jgi:hypothetical protein
MSTHEQAPGQEADRDILQEMRVLKARIREDMACAGTDPDYFYPNDAVVRRNGESHINPQILLAKAICDRCGVRKECEQYGEYDQRHDYRAGMRIYGGKLFGVRKDRTNIVKILRRHIELV